MVKNIKLSLFNIADFEAASEHPSLGLSYIASYLEKFSCFQGTKIFVGRVLDKLKQDPPDIIGISSVTEHFTKAIQYAKTLKKMFNVPVIIGGVHISSLPQLLPDCFDVAVLGEGEETMRELIGLFLEKGFAKDELGKIRGIAYHENGEIKITPARELISNMDVIPLPQRNTFHQKGFFHILTSRGCPYRCSFCSSSIFWNKVRFFSPQYVVGEIKSLIDNFGAKHISIWDDIFIVNKTRFKKIVELIREEGIYKRVTFGCSARANLVDDEICCLMQSMNITHVDMGLESGSENMLKLLKKDSVNVSDNSKAIDLLKKYGFVTKASFIIGSPNETREDILETWEFIKNSNLDGGVVNVAVPYPGTEFWNYALERNLVSNNMDFGRLSIITRFSNLQKNDFILLTDKISVADFIEMGAKIETELSRRSVRNLFSRNNFNLHNFGIVLSNPKLALKIVRESLSNMFKGLTS